MKKLLILLLLAVSAAAEAQQNDTLTIRKPQRVRIITGDSIQQIKVWGREDDEKYTYESSIQLVDSNYVSETSINKDWGFSIGIGTRKSKKGYPNKQWLCTSRLGIGLCAAVGADDGVSVTTGSSWEIFWTIAAYERFNYNRRNGYSAGFGIGWRNFRMTGHNRFTKADDGTIGVAQYPEGSEPDFSRIKVFSLQIPLLWRYRFNDNSQFALGPVINFNTYASLKTRYRDADGHKHKDVEKRIHQRPLTVDLMAELCIRNFASLYVKYSPMSILQPSYADGSNFQTLSFGIYL